MRRLALLPVLAFLSACTDTDSPTALQSYEDAPVPAFFSFHPSDPNLVVNGSFEEPGIYGWGHYANVPGWTPFNQYPSSQTPVLEIQRIGVVIGSSYDGQQIVELDTNSYTGIEGFFQDIPTDPGISYSLRFGLARRGSSAAADNVLRVRWNDVEISTPSADYPGWRTFEYHLWGGPGSTSRLEFADLGWDNGTGTLLDGVRVVRRNPVPTILLMRDDQGCGDPYIEGGRACINGGETYDPEGDDITQLAFFWDYGDGTPVRGPVIGPGNIDGEYSYADNGDYLVTLRVEDTDGLSGHAQRVVPVANVAPTVRFNPAKTVTSVVAGETFTLYSSFDDPGLVDAPWSWVIDWADGTTAEGTILDNSGEAVHWIGKREHTYLAAGTHEIRVSVGDKDHGWGSANWSVEVTITFDLLCSNVEAWVSHKGLANSLCVKLAAAARAEARGQLNARNGSLNAFISEVVAQTGKKVPDDKAPLLVASARWLMR